LYQLLQKRSTGLSCTYRQDPEGIEVISPTAADLVAAPADAHADHSRPVVMGTFSVRFDPAAERFAIASALEADCALVVVNVLDMKPYPCTMRLIGPGGATLPEEEDLEPVRATARRAAALGIRTQLLRVTSSRRVRALLEIVRERNACLLVFGPDRSRMRERRYRRTCAQLGERAPCLVWTSLSKPASGWR
jgi:hypothetical protein